MHLVPELGRLNHMACDGVANHIIIMEAAHTIIIPLPAIVECSHFSLSQSNTTLQSVTDILLQKHIQQSPPSASGINTGVLRVPLSVTLVFGGKAYDIRPNHLIFGHGSLPLAVSPRALNHSAMDARPPAHPFPLLFIPFFS